ncbi:MAG: DUF1491 family protein [Pseudomonadota bacterium]
MRLTSEFVVSALIRRVEAAGAYATVARRGDRTAGAIFVLVDGLTGTVTLYGPAPASLEPPRMPDEAALTGNRLFVKVPITPADDRPSAEAHLERESQFDADLWVVEIEDRAMRSFVPCIDTH